MPNTAFDEYTGISQHVNRMLVVIEEVMQHQYLHGSESEAQTLIARLSVSL